MGKGIKIPDAPSVFSRGAASELTHGRKAVVWIREKTSRRAAKESFAATAAHAALVI
jgi:acyl CoA:acetate/3-ketoacid CoA transferase beta subunit